MNFSKAAGRIYVRNKEALEQARASAAAAPGTNPLHSGSNSRGIIVMREEAVKQMTHPNSANMLGCSVLPVAEHMEKA